MGIVETLLVSIGLAMDAFAVSVSKGLALKKMSWEKAIITGLWFGIFQAGMPMIGYFLGATLEKAITACDHWIAFILLAIIGGKMILEALNKKEDECKGEDMSFKSMLILAIATSIDALAIGIAYMCAYGNENAAITFTSIGIVTFLLSILGVKIGNRFGKKYEKKAEFAGGLILVILGLKILLEHLEIF